MDLLKQHLSEVIEKTWNFAGRCKTKQDEICNAGFGLAGEAGEVADQLKKYMFHSEKPWSFHREKLVSELGDVYFYLLKLQDLTGISTEECIAGNAAKLRSRHPELGAVSERFPEGYIK